MLIEKQKSTLVIIDVQEKLVSVIPKPHLKVQMQFAYMLFP